ncbi:MAG: EAL domain-containing protein [Roseobacter sp.]
MHISVVAEGVETPEHYTSVAKLGCDLVQGYPVRNQCQPMHSPTGSTTLPANEPRAGRVLAYCVRTAETGAIATVPDRS